MFEHLTDIRCRGCLRLLGVGPRDFRIYCDEMCAADIPPVTAEDRDALIECIYQDHERGIAKTLLGEMFGVSRQRIDQILVRRTEALLQE